MRRLLTYALLTSSLLLPVAGWATELPIAVPASAPLTLAEGPQTLTLSLQDAIALAFRGNYALAASRVGLERDEWDPYIARGIFDRTLNLGLTHSQRQRGGTLVEEQVVGGSDTDSTDLSATMTVPTTTGGSWSLSYNAQRTDISGSSSSSGEDYNSDLTLRYRHPLLEGSGSRRTRSPITQAELGVEISRNNLERELLTLEQTVTQQYLAVLRAQRQLETATLSLEVANALYRQIGAQVDAGALAEFERTNAEGGLATREESVLLAEQSLENAKDELLQTLGLDRDTELILEQNPVVDPALPTEYDTAWDIAATARPELDTLRLREELADVQLADAKDALQDDLNFTASAGLNGDGDDYGESLEGMDDFAWTLGFEYIIPLGPDRRAKGQFEQAKLALDQIALERSETETQIGADLSQALRDVEVAARRLDITDTGVRVAEERLENERARLDLGLTTATAVLEVEEDLAQARRSRIEAELNVVSAQARLLNVIGRSQLMSGETASDLTPSPAEE